jgi:hypothetical protein
MNAQLEGPRRTVRSPEAPEAMPREEPAGDGPLKVPLKVMLRIVVLLLLGGLILFAHGCHGDEDNELFGVVRALMGD